MAAVMTDLRNTEPDPLLGALLGSWSIEQRLGSGGMGVVYRATDRHLRRTVAIKTLKPEFNTNREMRQRFEKEASSAAGIEHPNVVRIYAVDFDVYLKQQYIVMQYIDGPDLASVLQDGAMEHARAMLVFGQVASALQAVHEQGLVHRDVKPENVLLRNAGTDEEQAMLTDFGIAKAVDSQTALTVGAIGTPDYMSPEVANLEPATDRSDQYALAVVLYRMLSGERLFEGLEVPRAHRDESVPDLSARLPSANRAMRAAIARALEKDPAQRFASVAAFAEAVRESQEAEPNARPPLQQLMEQVLSDAGPLSAAEIADAVCRRLPADDVGVTQLQVEGRARLFAQLFHCRPDGRIALRSR
jgi:serine/threonine protein kinase